jgi:hypothetical protein
MPQLRAARHGNRQRSPREGTQCRAAEGDDRSGSDFGDLEVEPEVASIDLAQARLLVQPALAARLPLEVLDGVGDVHGFAVEA